MKTERQNQTDREILPASQFVFLLSVHFPFVPLSAHFWLPLHISLCSFLPHLDITQHQMVPVWSTVTHTAHAHSLRTAGASSIFIHQRSAFILHLLHSSADFWGNNLRGWRVMDYMCLGYTNLMGKKQKCITVTEKTDTQHRHTDFILTAACR